MEHWVWNVSPILFSVGPFSVRWYGAIFAVGFYIALQLMNRIARREKLEPREFDGILLPVILGTVIGARLGHVFFYDLDLFLEEPLRILKVWEGGLASHGGTVGVILAVLWWRRKHYRGTLLSLLDYLAVPSAFVAGMIRLGNLFNSEILGRPSEVPWAVVFRRQDELPRHPAMIYESVCYFALFAVLWLWVRRGVHRRRGEGFLFGFFFTVLFGARFAIEFVKEVQVAQEAAFPLDFGQLLSIPFVLCGVFFLVRALRRADAAPKR